MKSLSKTPAPLKDRIHGSKVNPKGSASSEKSASKIKLDAKTILALNNKLKEFKETHSTDKVSLNDLKAVYRRGLGAYSSSHRPTISGGKPNTRNAWAMARVNKFLLKASGGKVKEAYVQDDDLLKMHLGGDMSKHLAPNGKPSNLTHEQWHMVRTPEFKAWFGDWENNPEEASKVVDENGEPMVVYHGSRNDFNEFILFKGKFGSGKTNSLGHYFTKDKSRASLYGSVIKSFFLKSKNPKVLNSFEEFYKWVDKDLGYNTKDYYEISNDNKGKVAKIIQKNKFDGLIVKSPLPKIRYNEYKDEYNKETDINYVVYKSNQIKLADGTNTTFDGSNPDIRYDGGGDVKTDFNEYQNEGFRKALLSMWHDFSDGYISKYLDVEKENYVLTDHDNMMVIFRNGENFTDVEKAKIENWIEPYLDQYKKPEIAKYIVGYEINGNKIIVKTNPKESFKDGGEVDYDEAIKQFRIAYPIAEDERYLTSNERRSIGIKSYHARKRLEKVLGFDMGNLPSLTDKQRRIREEVYERLRESRRYDDGGLIPQQGTLYTKDKKSKLEYYKKGNDYAFKVYDVENNPVENYTRNQYKKRGENEVLMTYKQFINYLYTELYLDDKYADGGQIIYSAIFFDVDKMLNAYGQVHPNLFSHHSTIEFKPKDISHLPIGEEVMVEVVGRLTTPKVDALIVRNPFSKNEFPHITLSTAIGVKPFETNNEIKNNLDKIEPFNDELYGIVGYFDGKSDVTTFSKGGKVGSKRYWFGYKYKGLYIVKFEGEQWSYWNIWKDEYATDEVAIGFNTKRDAMDWIDRNQEKYDDGGDVDDLLFEHPMWTADSTNTLPDKLLEENWLSEDKRYILSHEDKIKFRDTEQEDYGKMKPRGLWYGIGDGWARFLAYEMPHWAKDNNNLFEIEVTDKVLKLNTLEDANDFSEKYGSYHFVTGFTINWKKVSEEWSGIEVKNPYQWSRQEGRSNSWMYLWDVPSGCIWKEDGIKSIKPIITNYNYIDNKPSYSLHYEDDYKDGGDVKTDFNEYQNEGFRKALLSMWHDFSDGYISKYLDVEKENYVLTDYNNMMVIFRNGENFTDVEKAKIENWIEPYIDQYKKPEIAKYIVGYEINGNKIIVKTNPKESFKDGGVTDIYTKKEIKKAYVSIRIKNDIERNPDSIFKYQVASIDLKPFQELSEGYLDGILGVSTSVHNVADWFSHRECLVVMPFDKFVEYNETEQIRYDDLASLTKNGLDVFFRLFDRKGRGENEYYDVLGNIFQKISRELQIDAMVSPMADKLYYASELFDTFNSRKFREYFAKQPRVNSPLDFAKITKEYINSGQAEKDGYYGRVSEINYSDVLPSIERGILANASAYKDESEWLILNKRLDIPEGSQLFFSLGSYENLKSKYEELIDTYNLRKNYSVYFVKNQDIEKFRQIKYNEKDKIFKEQLSEAKSQIDKKILMALESVTTDLILDYQKKVIKEITEYGSEYYIDEETNERYPSIFEIPQFINLFDLAFLKLNELMEAQFENVVKNKNKYHLVNAWNEYRLYIEKLIEENDGKEFDFEDSSYHKVYIDWMYRHMKYAMNDIDIYEYMSRIKNKVGSDLYRYFSKDEISSLKYGGTTEKYQISDYWDEESYKDGGEVKTKKIITDKIGWNESVADFFIEQDPKLAIWFADGYMKYHLTLNYLPENSSQEFFDLFKIKISDKPTKEEWDSLPINIKKTIVRDAYPNYRDFFINGGSGGIPTQPTRADFEIRYILDWLKHPITPKQDLKSLSILEAVQKAKQWHDELKSIGGDVDFIEPEENKKIIQYPIDDKEVEFYWVQIPKTFCDLESKRMGHCGRTGSGDSLISLRSIRPFGKGHTINDSHVTIAYNEKEGYFYQLKGKKNAKPSEKYFPYIFDLIKNLAKEDRYLKIDAIDLDIDNKWKERNQVIDSIETLKEEIIDNNRKYQKFDDLLIKVKNNREFDAINQEMDEIKKIIKFKELSIFKSKKTIDEFDNYIKEKEKDIDKIRKMSQYGFSGFGTEYASSEDYGWFDMTDEQIKELKSINPELFKGLVGEVLLYERKLSDKKPNTTFKLAKDLDYLEDIFDFGRNIDPRFIKSVLEGEPYYDSYRRSDREILNEWLDDLDDESVEIVVDRISEITSLPKQEVAEDGIEYYLNGDYNEEHEKDYDFDEIFDRINRAIGSAEQDDYTNHYYKEIKYDLEKVGKIISINDVDIELDIDLLDHVNMNELSELIRENDSDNLGYLFEQGIYQGTIEKPKIDIDDRYSGFANKKDLNEYFKSDDYYKKGGTIKDKQEVDNHEIFNYTDIDSFDGSSFMLKDGGEVDDNKETYAKWKQLVNMSYSELNRFYNSEEGKKAGLTPSQASAQGIDSGRESARWILKMKKTPKSEWTPQMWKWAKKQISFISRMSGNKGKLYDDKGRKTRKYLSLLIWGNNPEKN